MIYLIKFIYSFFLPPGFFLLLLIFFAFWLSKRDKAAAKILIGIVVIFYLFSTNYVGDLLITSLEGQNKMPAQISGDVIILLGGGATLDTPDLQGKGHLSGSAANRLLTAVRLQKRLAVPIIFTGGKVYQDSGNEALIAQRMLLDLGVPKEQIILETASRNTTENAQNTKTILLKNHFQKPILVTSAFHLPRSVLNFAKVGVRALPVPADYQSSVHLAIYLNKFTPSANGLMNSSIALREYLGILAL